MRIIHPQFITDTAGEKLVIISLNEFDDIMEELDELEDLRLYDNAKKNDDGKRILLSDYLKKRKEENA